MKPRTMNNEEKKAFARFTSKIMEDGSNILAVAAMDRNGTFHFFHCSQNPALVAFTEAATQEILNHGSNVKAQVFDNRVQ